MVNKQTAIDRFLERHPLLFGLLAGYAFFLGLWIGAMAKDIIMRGAQ